MTDNNYADAFSLSITEALRSQLTSAMRRLTPVSLTPQNINSVQSRPGVYELFDAEGPAYIGKADRSLRDRLGNHFVKTSGRQHGLIAEMRFRCLYVEEDMGAIAPEEMLIKGLSAEGSLRWNNNGFGNKDPGKFRDRSKVKANHFDALYPIDLDSLVSLDATSGELTFGGVAEELKRILPFTLRFDPDLRTAQWGKAELEAQDLTLLSARDALSVLSKGLPAHWRAVALPGYVIAYPDIEPSDFPSRLGHWTGGDGRFIAHDPDFASPGAISTSASA